MKAAAELLRWFDGARRDLPWRRTRDPYAIWVSEVMLQQTRVETVVGYYERFLERFPTVYALAAAELDETLALWSGLGYYRRARQMHRAARELAARGGGFPESPRELEELPGIGPYTAAAIASIAFGVAAPVVDGNVARVVSRLEGYGGGAESAAGRKRLAAAAGRLLDPGRPGDSNQALMELGALVCRPRAPRCGECPLAARCVARAEGEPERYPPPRARRPTERMRRLGALVEESERVLLIRRPDESELLAGTWEVPWVEWSRPRAAERRLGARYGGSWRLGRSRGWLRHGITFRDLEVEVREARLTNGSAIEERGEAGWFGRDEIAGLAASSLVRKILARPAGRQP